jgi:Protein of unknown function (DUF1826)
MGNGPEVLAAIRRRAVNLAVWRRRLPRSVARFASACLSLSDLHVGFEATRAEIASVLADTIATPRQASSGDRQTWIADVAALARLFASATDARGVSVHVELLDHDACRLFHVDNVRCRLITAYAGPGTDWLRDADVDREALGGGGNQAVLRPGARIEGLRTGWIGLFKGERLPAMRGRGIVHRSAPVLATGRRRLVVKIGHAGEIPC